MDVEPQPQFIKLETGVERWNFDNLPGIKAKIEEARQRGWELFPDKLLENNYSAWTQRLTQLTDQLPPAWLKGARNLVNTMPLQHVIHPGYISQAVKKGHVEALSKREDKAKGRTIGAYRELGLDDYVYLSFTNSHEASGIPIFLPARRVLEQEGTIVTIADSCEYHLGDTTFDQQVEMYQKSAFRGKDFIHILPHFLVAHYGDLSTLQSDSKRATQAYPQEMMDYFGPVFLPHRFSPEIKVKDVLYLKDDFRINPSYNHKPWEYWVEAVKDTENPLEDVIGISEYDLKELETFCRGHVLQEPDILSSFTQHDQTWWMRVRD